MADTWREHIKKTAAWTIRALLVALVTAPAITLLAAMIAFASRIRHTHPWIILLIPFGAVATTYLFSVLGPHLQQGSLRIMSLISKSEAEMDGSGAVSFTTDVASQERPISTRLAPLLLVTTFITHLVGASGGKEGVGVQVGSSLASYIGEAESRLRHRTFPLHHQGVYLISGAAAGFAALFNAPVAGVLFGLQFSNPRVNRIDAFFPALVAAYSATMLSQAMHIPIIETVAPETLPFTAHTLLILLLVAILFGLLSRLFCTLIYHVKHLTARLTDNVYLRTLFTSTLLLGASLAIYLAVGSFEFNGLSTHLIKEAGLGSAHPLAPLFKFVLTILTIASGFIGGEVVPVLVIGSTSGALLASLLGSPAATLSMMGAMGMLSGATKLPLACFALGLELYGFSNPSLLFFVCAVSYFISGPASIYRPHQ